MCQCGLQPLSLSDNSSPVFQPSPSTSSLSSTHSASPNVTSSAPSSARGQCQGGGWLRVPRGPSSLPQAWAFSSQWSELTTTLTSLSFRLFPASPLLSDKHKHSRENSCLSPRERPCSAIYPTPVEPSQVAFGGWKSSEKRKSLDVTYRAAENHGSCQRPPDGPCWQVQLGEVHASALGLLLGIPVWTVESDVDSWWLPEQ